MPLLPDARGPHGLRLYAVGDVHGCLDDLLDIADAIARDLDDRPVADWRAMLLGDYVDRGPDSAGVLEWLAGPGSGPDWIALAGNHDRMMTDFLADPDCEDFATWLGNGGLATLASFGIRLTEQAEVASAYGRARLRDRLLAAMSEGARAALEGLVLSARFGDFFFAHAGIRPGVPLDAQSAADLLWIRGEFLDSTEDFGAVVVHGHTPTREVVVRPNRIGIDTGAVFGGPLTCLVIEEDRRALLSHDGLSALPRPAEAIGD